VRVTCFKLGTSSLGLRYLFTVGDTVCVDARMTTVCVELETLKSFEIPGAYRARFEALMEAE
jgi:4-hydroxybenzoyl-CoA thioesterase